MRKSRIIAVILVLCTCFSLCGAGWFDKTKVIIDTESNNVYRYCTADAVIADFVKDDKAARKQYKDSRVFISGKIQSIGESGKNLMLTGISNTDLTMECSYNKELRKTVSTYKAGEKVALYGKITVSIFDDDLHLKVDKIAEVPVSISSSDIYYLLDGTSFDKTDAEKITLNNGGVEFYVPSSWTGEDVQFDVSDSKISTMECYQYVLNKLDGGYSTPESFFIGYFDNRQQLSDYLNDSDETEQIAEAIVENILGSVSSSPTKKVDTYYGSEYRYYTGSYKTAFDTGTGYHTEFVFQADGEEGIVVMLYVYKEPKHVSDILFVSRFLEIK